MKQRHNKPHRLPVDAEVTKIGLNEAWIEDLLRKAQPSEHVWQASRRTTTVEIEGCPMECSFVVEVGSTDIRAAEGCPGPIHPGSLLEAVFYGMSKPQTGIPYRPKLVLFDSLRAVEMFARSLAEVGVEARYQGLLEDLEIAWKRMRFLNRDHANPN